MSRNLHRKKLSVKLCHSTTQNYLHFPPKMQKWNKQASTRECLLWHRHFITIINIKLLILKSFQEFHKFLLFIQFVIFCFRNKISSSRSFLLLCVQFNDQKMLNIRQNERWKMLKKNRKNSFSLWNNKFLEIYRDWWSIDLLAYYSKILNEFLIKLLDIKRRISLHINGRLETITITFN